MWENIKKGWENYRIFVVLYFVQGLIGSFLAVTLLFYLQRVISSGVIGKAQAGLYISMLGWPWLAKPVFAAMVDNWVLKRFGVKRSEEALFDWVLIATSLMLGGLLLLAFGQTATTLMYSAVAVNLGRAIQDVATDALSIHLVPRKERGPMQASVATTTYLGEWCGGAGSLMILARLDWFWLVMAVVAVAAMLGLFWPRFMLLRQLSAVTVSDAYEDSDAEQEGAAWKALLKSFWGVLPILAILLALTAHLCESTTSPVIFPWLSGELQYGKAYLGVVFTAVTLTKIPGVWLGAGLLRKLGDLKGMVMALLGKACAYFLIGALAFLWVNQAVVFALIMLTGIFDGACLVALRSYFMGLTAKRAAATQFSVYMAAMNASAIWASFVGGMIAEEVSISTVFMLAAGMQLSSLLVLGGLRLMQRKG